MDKNFIQSDSPTPIYHQVADWMIDNITSGTWKIGHKLRSEEELSKELNISRGTLRKTISILIERGLLVRIQGKGTFVEKQRISYPFAQELISFAESMEAKGYSFQTKVLQQKVVNPNILIQNKLGLNDYDLVLYLKRVRYIKNEPAILLENWVSLKWCPGIEREDFEKTSLFKGMEKYANSKITFGTRRFSAKSLNEEQAELLQLKINEPVLHIDQVTFANKELPLEHSQVVLRTDKYDVTSILSR